jgi:hypothetical protein
LWKGRRFGQGFKRIEDRERIALGSAVSEEGGQRLMTTSQGGPTCQGAPLVSGRERELGYRVTSQDFIKFWGKIFIFILLVLIENSQGFKTF